ncbi:hypothetical protein J2X37_002182 [Croceicoccus sp. BE223]|nr:hypothetical protein [Croceicoccus sp. BE223]
MSGGDTIETLAWVLPLREVILSACGEGKTDERD